MESLRFPRAFLESPEIVYLSGAQKFLLAGIILMANPAGVLILDDLKCVKLSFLPSVAAQLLSELVTRRLLAFDAVTKEVFVSSWFHWQNSPDQVGQEPTNDWGIKVSTAISHICSENIRSAVDSAVLVAPAEKLDWVQVPGNLLTSIRHPPGGKRWEATPLLLFLALYTQPTMSWAGVCVADYECLAMFASASGPSQIVGHLRDLDDAESIVFDHDTGEIFVKARLRKASTKHMDEILSGRLELVSHRIKTNFSMVFKQTFGISPNKTISCRLESDQINTKTRARPNSPSPSPEECWLKSTSHPLAALALRSLFDSAQQRNKKGSNEELDVARCRRGLELAEMILTDETAAAAINELFAAGGWPREVESRLRNVKSANNVQETTKAAKVADKKNVESGNVGRELVGKKLRLETGLIAEVRMLGAMINGQTTPLCKLSEMVRVGKAIVIEDLDQEEAA